MLQIELAKRLPQREGMHMTVDEAGKNCLLLYIPSLEFGAR